MLDHCSYHLLESLVPPSADEDISITESLLRLENICARTIVREMGDCKTLSEIPTHLHKILWKAYLKDEYYANEYSLYKSYADERGSTPMFDFYLLEIPELLYHWPHEEFILKEVMPTFPPRLNRFTPVSDINLPGPFFQYLGYLQQFYENVVRTIYDTLTISFYDSFLEQHTTEICKLRKVNITGFHILPLTMDDMVFDEPFLENSICKLELILDISLPYGEAFFSHTYNDVAYKFGHLSLGGDATQLIETLVDNTTTSVNLDGITEGSDVIEKVFKTNASQANILAIGLNRCAASVNFVQYFINLVHLDLSSNNLHGCLNSLMHMHRGLLFLNLHNCHLNNEDLDQLRGSCHQSTLRELILSDNSFNYDKNSNNFISLFQNLTSILKLDLEHCELESWQGHSNEIALLFCSFKNLPNIVYLNLYTHGFSIDTVTKHIMVLRENYTLRYLKLSLPKEFNEGHVYNKNDWINSFCTKMNEKINMHSQLLYVDFHQHYEPY